MKINKGWIPVFLAPAVVLFLLIYAVPLGMVFVTSLFDYRLTGPGMTFIGFGNYIRLFQDPDFAQALRNTVVWILIHCIIHVALGTLIALVLYKKPRGWKFVRTAYMIPNIISNAAIGMIFLNIFNPQFGVINSVLKAVGLEHLTRNWLMNESAAFPSVTMIWLLFAGYTTTLVLAQALSIDESVLEAARVDGASPFQTDLFIVLPLLRKIIGTLSESVPSKSKITCCKCLTSSTSPQTAAPARRQPTCPCCFTACIRAKTTMAIPIPSAFSSS